MTKPQAKAKIRIMVVEDHFLIRMGLITASEVEPDIAVVAEVEDGSEAVEAFRKHRPDVVLLDLRMPGMDGIATATALRKEFGPIRILMLSSYGADEDIYRAVQAGAAGYVLKDMPLKLLVAAIRVVHSGQQYFPPEIAARLADRMRHSHLTPREIEVLGLAAKGKSNKEIAAALGIVEGTVKVHVTNIFSKLDAVDRTQAVTTAIKRGILQVE